MDQKFSIVIGVRDAEMAVPIQDSLKLLPTTVIIGSNYPSWSKLVNDAILQAENETIIFVSHRVRPTPKDIEKILSLLESGYGLVGLYRFAFFGFRKELIRRVGFFDESFLQGGWADDDYQVRLLEADIAYYEEESVPYFAGKSLWDQSFTPQIFKDKWKIENGYIERKRPEPENNYNIGNLSNKLNSSIFLSWSKSHLMQHTIQKYYFLIPLKK